MLLGALLALLITRSKKLLGAPSLLGARTLLGALLALLITRSKKLLKAPSIATRSKHATRGTPGLRGT